MNSYSGNIIHPKVSGGRGSGNIEINASCLTFLSDEITHTIPLTQLNISAGGAGNRYIFFKDVSNNEISIYTSEKFILKNTHLTSNSRLVNSIKDSHKTIHKWLYSLATISCIILIFVGLLYLSKDYFVEKIAKQVPKEWEQKAGDKLFSTLSLQYQFIKNDTLEAEFLKIAEPLLKQVKKEGYPVDLYFVNDPTINAFALPGGKIIIQSGLIENAKSWEEVMGVLGHELAHVTRRHHVRGIINNIGIYTLLSVTIGDISALAGTFINLGGEMATLSNSRSFENEADETGWDFLVKAKINPKGMISFFETLKKNSETELTEKLDETIDLSFLSTHPNTQDRIDVLKEKLKQNKDSFIPLPNNIKNFKLRLKKTYQIK